MNVGGILPGGEAAKVSGVVQNAEWLPHTFDTMGDSLVFVRVPQDVRDAIPFLNGKALDRLERIALPFASVAREVQSIERVPLNFIFHTALCGSTLLVKALEATGSARALKEPAILLNLYFRLLRGNSPSEIERLDLVLSLLARPFAGSGSVVVKAPCMVGPLVRHIMRLRPRARAILLRSAMRGFLLAVAKRGIRGRSWGRQIFADSRRTIPLEFGFDNDETLQHTDLQVAGLAGLMRRWLFDRIANELGPERVFQITADQLFLDPGSSMQKASAFLGFKSDPETVQQIVQGPVFRLHSKEAGRSFDNSDREREAAELDAVHKEEVDTVMRWLTAVAEQRGVFLD